MGVFKKLGDLGFHSFTTLYHSYILPVAHYAVGVRCFKDYPALQVLQNRITQVFFGVHRFAPFTATSVLIGLPSIRYTRWGEMLKLHNRILSLSPDTLPRKVCEWEVSLGHCGWIRDVEIVARALYLPALSERALYDTIAIQEAVLKILKDDWWEQVEDKLKHRSFTQFVNNDDASGIKSGEVLEESAIKNGMWYLSLEVEVGRC